MRSAGFSLAAVLTAAVVVAACGDATAPESTTPAVVVSEGRLFTPDDAAAFARRTTGTEFSLPADFAALVAADGDSEGEQTQCVGVLTGAFDFVVVPEGAECFLVNSTVRKHVTALEGSALGIANTTIGGDVKGKKAASVNVSLTQVGGNVLIHDGGPHPLYVEVYLCGVTLAKGNVQIHSMRGGMQVGLSGANGVFCVTPNRIERGHLELKENFVTPNRLFVVRGNFVGGDGKIFKNEGPGAKFVQTNTFAKQLDCKGNDAPFVGGPNVAKRIEGQCF